MIQTVTTSTECWGDFMIANSVFPSLVLFFSCLLGEYAKEAGPAVLQC